MNCEETVTEIDLWEPEIIDNELHPCMQDELNQLKLINKDVGEIIQDFAIDELYPSHVLGNLNWHVAEKSLDPSKNGYTETNYDTNNKIVTTYFDSNKLRNGTNLAAARTILHEAVHAYVVSVAYSYATYSQRLALVGDDWASAYDNFGHDFIASSYVNHIADALEAFGNSKGYSLNRQFYEDMSWAGLYETDEFKLDKSPEEKQRIKDVVLIEQTGRDEDGNYRTQKGEDSGC